MKKNDIRTNGDEILEVFSFILWILAFPIGAIVIIFALDSISSHNILNEPDSVTIARQRSELVRQDVLLGKVKPQPKPKKPHWVYAEFQKLEEANACLADPNYDWEMYNIARGGPYTLRRLEK